MCGDRDPAHAVVPGAVGVLRLRAPGHKTADPNGGASELAPAPRPARAVHHHPAPLAFAPAQHLHLGGHDPLRLRRLEQDAVQPLQHARRWSGLAVHDVGEVRGADARSPGDLVLADAVSVHPAPHRLPVDAGGLRRSDLHRGLQRCLDPRLDLHAHVAMTPRHHATCSRRRRPRGQPGPSCSCPAPWPAPGCSCSRRLTTSPWRLAHLRRAQPSPERATPTRP